MTTESTIIVDSATTVYINHAEASYGMFCYNSKGDLFLNADWGFYGFAWRHFGERTFEEFLSTCNADYITGKFAINYNQDKTRGRFLGGKKEQMVKLLVQELINVLNDKRSVASKAASSTTAD